MSKIEEAIEKLQGLVDSHLVPSGTRMVLLSAIDDLRSDEDKTATMEGEVEQMLEDLETASGFLCQGDFPDTTKDTIVFLQGLRDGYSAAEEKLAAPGNMLEQTCSDEDNIATSPNVMELTGGQVRSDIAVFAEDVFEASDVHPLDINQTALGKVAEFMRRLQAMPGSENLGKDNYVVVLHPDHVAGDVVDSIRSYLVEYGEGRHRAQDMRSACRVTGRPALHIMPDWFAKTYGYISKGGFGMLLYHTMIMSQLDPAFNQPGARLSSAELGKMEEQLMNGEIPSIKIPSSLQ